MEDLRAERFGSVSHSGSTERTGGVSLKEGGECGWNESSVVCALYAVGASVGM